MSRRKRRQRGKIRAEPSAAEVFSKDGYVNRPAFLGEASELLSAGTFERSGLTQNTKLLTTMYRENWLAKKIIDIALHHWDGTNGSLKEALDLGFPGAGAFIKDNMDGTVTGNVEFPSIAGIRLEVTT